MSLGHDIYGRALETVAAIAARCPTEEGPSNNCQGHPSLTWEIYGVKILCGNPLSNIF